MTVRAIARLDNPALRHGQIWQDHQPLHSMRPHKAAASGLKFLPEARPIITHPTVEDNLQRAQIAPPSI